MHIRPANVDDLTNIAQLHGKSWQENYSSVLSGDYLAHRVLEERTQIWTERLTSLSDNQLVLVAQLDGVFSGFICVFGDKHPQLGSIIDNLHVTSEAKGKGIGTQLITSAAKWAQTYYKDCGLYLEVLECNPKAIGFYEALGGQKHSQGYWHTPCGNKVKEFIYVWQSPLALIK
ncbi:GNAT family N-acetyltransferase [Pseudoalteromonas sp. MMG022]|uniref:GNAT family N-acetyltransferase n=1 Tax=Pseudoalteromonas sp. MMG022 TaxID=2909978 RepID=UPI001F237390|nr:GNAT family N-acetyltransferase [Pseudoalteromonas sp. MMG022]MCF6436764.1 GNAT family N-acetyltransferase [Pseudoalteromonas sp. MMG022]